jgi:hypothetical protein
MNEQQFKDIISYEKYGFPYDCLTNNEKIKVDKIYNKEK